MSWVAVGVGVGGAVIGGMASQGAADTAAGAQRDASAQSNALQRYIYDTNNAIAAPAINTGNAARDRLSMLLGLTPSGSQAGGGSQTVTYEQLRQQLLPQYTTTTGPAGSVDPYGGFTRDQVALAGNNPLMGGAVQFGDQTYYGNGIVDPKQSGYWGAGANGQDTWVPGTTTGTSTVDNQGLEAAIQARLAQQEQERQAAINAVRSDPAYGSLAQQYTPNTFSYTGQDLYNDPSYQFRLQQGQKALDRQGAAAGRFLSGGQLQAASDYNQGAASQEFGNAYNRALGTFNTNEGNRFNAYQTNFTNTVNPLLALSGAGQLAGTNLMQTGTQYAGAVGNNLQGAANATGAAAISGANAINSGISNVSSIYNTNSLLNRFGGSLNSNPFSSSSSTFYNNPVG